MEASVARTACLERLRLRVRLVCVLTNSCWLGKAAKAGTALEAKVSRTDKNCCSGSEGNNLATCALGSSNFLPGLKFSGVLEQIV